MSRYGYYGRRDDQEKREGDTGFVALNQKIEPTQLAPGSLSEAVNVRLRRGIAETRPGMTTPGHFNALSWGLIYGSGVYREVDSDREWMLLATSLGVFRVADGHYPEQIALPPSESITDACEFVQAQRKVLLFRGANASPLEWDGRLSSPFRFISMSATGNGINPIPNAETAELFANRLLVPLNRDEVAVSDILDYTRYDSVFNQFKIQSGTNERLMRMLPFSQASVLMIKSRSTYALQNVYGDLSQVQLVTVSRNIGTCARRSVVMVGGDAMMLSENPPGVYRIQQIIQDRLQASPVPVSDPIEPLIKRINWAAADRACAALWEEYYLLAVPLDGATVNNAVLVFNTVGGENGAGAWESCDTFPPVVTAPSPDLADFDFAVARYSWVSGNGTDLDTRTAILNLDASVNGHDVGWDRLDHVGGASGNYLTWGGDNMSSDGPEAVLVNFKALKTDFPDAASCDIRLRAFWYAARGNGNLTIQIATYKNGTMAPSGFDFINTGGTLVNTLTLSRNAATQQSGTPSPDGDDMATIHYNFATGTGSLGGGSSQTVSRPLGIDEFRISAFDGRQRLFGLDHGNGLVYLFEEGKTDRILSVENPVRSRITTRAYTLGGTLDRKRLARIQAALVTWNPRYSITVNPTGIGERFVVAENRTRDRSAFSVFGVPAYSATDAAVVHGIAHREDYSAACPFKCKTDLRLTRKQDLLERSAVRLPGRWATVTIENAQGQCDVRSIAIEGDETDRNTRRAA